MNCSQEVKNRLQLFIVDSLSLQDQFLDILEHVASQFHHLLLFWTGTVWRNEFQKELLIKSP